MTSETLVEGLAGGGVQYAQPLTGSAPPLWSRSTRGGRGLEPELALNHDLRAPAHEPEGARAGESTADPEVRVWLRHHDPAESISPTARCPQR